MQHPEVDFSLEEVRGRRIVLIGYMGAGKTTLARRWALAGGPPLWFDSDRAVLERLGASSVQEAFAGGEQRFRDVEREVIVERAALPALGAEIWSLGGGAPIDADVQRALFDATVVWVDAPEDVLWQRAANTDRPLATTREEFLQRYRERRPVYSALADAHVDTGGDGPSHLPGMLRGMVPLTWFDAQLAVDGGLLHRFDDLALLQGASVALVADAAVQQAADLVRQRLTRAGAQLLSDELLPMGEWHKQLATAESLLRSWSSAGLSRDSVVVAIGGGTLLDVAGFAASVYQRGVRWVSVPTTVTAQVDAGIGGKTGVNLGTVKNVVGSVHFPSVVAIDPHVLASLPAVVVADGTVEAIKTGLLAGSDLLDSVDRAIATHDPASAPFERMVAGCAAWKDAVVREDPDDSAGTRAQLNLGHTVGHAIEAQFAGAVSHGAAVAVGIDLALRLSERLAGLEAAVSERYRELVQRAGVAPVPGLAALTLDELLPYLRHDKKRTSGGIGWVLLEDVGRPVTGVRVDEPLLREAWTELTVNAAARAARGAAAAGPPAPAPSRRVLVLFGVNLGELGRRDPRHYGSHTLSDLVCDIVSWAAGAGLVAECRQTDSLERFIAALHEARTGGYCGVIVNPGAWTHHERALHDAIEPIDVPVIEVHLSDVTAREEWRAHSVIAPVVDRSISGRGAAGYRTALEWLAETVDCRA